MDARVLRRTPIAALTAFASARLVAAGLAVGLALCPAWACTVGGAVIELPAAPAQSRDASVAFTCEGPESSACKGSVHLYCEAVGEGEFYELRQRDCADDGKQCTASAGCVPCFAGSYRCRSCSFGEADCDRNEAEVCAEDGSGWKPAVRCDAEAGLGCYQGECIDLCAQAEAERSYEGCVFYAADLDNAAIDAFNDASAQQYAVVVANPYDFPVGVTVEQNGGAPGAPLALEAIDQRDIPPGGLETFKLPRREVDGSSALGLNDGTHTALTSNAYRVTATHPISAYQFNPLDNVNVFSNDASLLLPTSALGREYTVVGWPQTIGDSDNPEDDFDPTSKDEDLRAFLTIIGTEADTELQLRMGPYVGRVIPGGPVAALAAGDVVNLQLGPFDVINLESDGKDGDFTGSVVTATRPVSVFTGSEASDVPAFSTYAARRCCADHLEEQLFPDQALGTTFTIARMPPRSQALAAAGRDDDPLSIAVVDEREWVRIVATAPGATRITTSLPSPEDSFDLEQYQDVMIEVNGDFMLNASLPIAVLQALPSQAQTGIPRQFPGGDPAIIAVPPAEQYRTDYIFLTPDKYAFDFVTIVADAETRISLDGAPLSFYRCETSPVPATPGDGEDPGRGGAGPEGPERVVHRCQLSFPEVTSGANAQVLEGQQNDGRHVLRASSEVGVVVYGFDRYVSYAYAAGLDLIALQ